jgi:acyl carrier protein
MPENAAERVGKDFTHTRTRDVKTAMSDTTQVKESIRNFINSSINMEGLDDDENLFETGLINSLFAIQLTNFVERTFGIEVGMDDLSIENFKSINATAAFVASKCAGNVMSAPPQAK